jgi:hypothetical protein
MLIVPARELDIVTQNQEKHMAFAYQAEVPLLGPHVN